MKIRLGSAARAVIPAQAGTSSHTYRTWVARREEVPACAGMTAKDGKSACANLIFNLIFFPKQP
ncbi:MAG: hypothetical protein LBK18_01610 [Prevotellaceae bacterium]|nr:hypothetical protein [Prevotellaceae bacterium]